MESALTMQTSFEVPIPHLRQHSQDSGAFIDWSSEDSSSPLGGPEEFVTVVSVESKEVPSPFVTVLEIGDTVLNEELIEEVLVYRLPGERLGFGLKFEGGTNTSEKVKKLFIQSSAPDSPASRAKCSWGTLIEGDEIVSIDGSFVREMTRLDCVRCLKESNVCIKLVVRHPREKKTKAIAVNGTAPAIISAEMKKSPPPPPIPPRKVPRKGPTVSSRDDANSEPIYNPVPKARSLQSEHKAVTRIPSNPSPDSVKRVIRRNSLRNAPPEAEVYLDLLAVEDEIRSNWGSESDDTASTISTIVGITNNTSFSDLPIDPSSNDFTFSKLVNDREPDSVSIDERSLSCDDALQPPPSFQDAPLSYANETVRPSIDLPDDEVFLTSLKNFPEENLEVIDLGTDTGEVKISPPAKKSSLIPRLAKSIGLLSPPKPSPRKDIPDTNKSKPSKKRPPPPPPPRSDRPLPDTQPTSPKSLKSSIPYLKKKKSKEDDKKALKLEKKAKKEKVSDREEAIVPFFEHPSPEEEDCAKLCWPVPELSQSLNKTDNILPEQEMGEFTVEAVTNGEPFFLFPWGSSKQLETIGEDEEELNEDAATRGNLEPIQPEPVKEADNPIRNQETIEEAPAGSSKTNNGWEVSFLLTATRDFLHEEILFNSVNGVVSDGITQDQEKEASQQTRIPALLEQDLNDAVEACNDTTPSVAALPLKANGDLNEVMDVVGCLPPPPYNRMPPDGHEFPQKYREEMPAAVDNGEMLKSAPPLPATEPPRRSLVEVLPSRAKSAAGWRQDERSGKSVRDKIAMFQSVPDAPLSPAGYSKLSKYKSSDDVFYDDEDRTLSKPFSRSIVSVDKCGGRKNSFSSTGGDSGSELGIRTQSSMDLTSCSSSAYSSSCSPDSSLSSTTSSSYLGYSSTLPRKARTTETIKQDSKPKSVTRTSSFNVHCRSQSMLDINPGSYGKTHEDKQTVLHSLVEQRKKTMSKLRGLVIPERSVEPIAAQQPILDLPEIRSRDLILTPSYEKVEKERRTSVGAYPTYSPVQQNNLITSAWSAQNTTPTIPKYSPAFKRKNISVYGTKNSDISTKFTSPFAPNKPPRTNGFSPRYSLDSIKPDSTVDDRRASLKMNDFGKGMDYFGRKGSDRSRSEEDSDNDSAVSSSRSSISPPASPLLGGHHSLSDVEKTPLARTLSSETTASGTSTASTLTSGSHASSDSDSQSKRILKAQSVEAINRKNVLTSAKYSRGFDSKNGSPLIQRKHIEDMLAAKLPSELKEKKYNDSTANEIVCYKLADEYNKSCDRVPEVKIAFLNHVEYDEVDFMKRKVEKTESSPVLVSNATPMPVPRRVSVPLCSANPWNNDWNPHAPLTPKISSESVRSRASSADTIIEKPLVDSTVSRMRAVESEGSFLDDPVDESPPRVRSARSSLGATDSSWGDSPRTNDASKPVLHKRGSSGSILDNLDDCPDSAKANGRIAAERMNARNRRSVSVNDIRKAFEKAELTLSNKLDKVNGTHARVSSLDSTTSDDSSAPYDSCNLHREQFGSITSLASSTSLISPQELQSLIDEANLTLEEGTGLPGSAPAGSHDVHVILLHRDSVGGSIGITLAGGSDYESKEITVHKVLAGSPADRDGRIQKGDRILSINGKSMKGVSHRESLAILKSPRTEVVLVISRLKAEGSDSTSTDDTLTSSLRSSLNGGTNRPPRITEGALLNEEVAPSADSLARGPATGVQLFKEGAGLGFSLEGGKDSPLGDKPLVIKKIFTGGIAEKSGLLRAGDEILDVNGVDVSQMSRIEAWKLMKRIPDGNVSITIRRLL